MSVERLSAPAVARLRQLEFTYGAVGCTAGARPSGLAELRRTRTLPPGTDFTVAARAVMGWQVQARAGLRVAASSLDVEPDAVVVLRIGLGPLGLSVPCRVAYIVDEADRRGFAYGILPGHPETGEESFVVERRADGLIEFKIVAFSRPATRLAKLGGPITFLGAALHHDALPAVLGYLTWHRTHLAPFCARRCWQSGSRLAGGGSGK